MTADNSDVVELAGVADLAKRWGVSTQRVRELAELDDFPEPVALINSTFRVYDAGECDGWRAARPKQAGRPRRAAA